MPATVFDANKAPTIIRLDAPQYGIAAGQAAVLYDSAHPERLLGGGWIVHAPLMADTCLINRYGTAVANIFHFRVVSIDVMMKELMHIQKELGQSPQPRQRIVPTPMTSNGLKKAMILLGLAGIAC